MSVSDTKLTNNTEEVCRTNCFIKRGAPAVSVLAHPTDYRIIFRSNASALGPSFRARYLHSENIVTPPKGVALDGFRRGLSKKRVVWYRHILYFGDIELEMTVRGGSFT